MIEKLADVVYKHWQDPMTLYMGTVRADIREAIKAEQDYTRALRSERDELKRLMADVLFNCHGVEAERDALKEENERLKFTNLYADIVQLRKELEKYKECNSILYQRNAELFGENSELREQKADPVDNYLTQALTERDEYHDMADQLADQIAAITGDDIGEHSSANRPWHNAMLAADEFIAKKIRALLAQPKVEPVQEPVAWRYQDARDNYRYRGYVPNFDVEYKLLKPIPLYAAPVPKADPVQEPYAWELFFFNGKSQGFTQDKGEADQWGEDAVPVYLHPVPDGLRKAAQMALDIWNDDKKGLRDIVGAMDALRKELDQ